MCSAYGVNPHNIDKEVNNQCAPMLFVHTAIARTDTKVRSGPDPCTDNAQPYAIQLGLFTDYS